MPRCPFCSNIIKENEEYCTNCNESLRIQCQYCKEYISVLDKKCPYCSSKLKKNSKSIFTISTYFLLLINCLVPYWFIKAVYNNYATWQKLINDEDFFIDLTSAIIGIFIISITPAIIALFLNYRKKFFLCSSIIFLIFCIINLTIACKI